jgi:soluble lytic murein transglycosylase
MKLTVWRVLAFLLLIAVSVGFGFAFDAVATAVERNRNPRPDQLADAVHQNAKDYGIPEAVLWATLKKGSHFASNAVSENNEIGLMQLTPAQFEFVCTSLWETDPMDTGMLYDPATNLRAGSAYLSYLYGRYGVWEHVFAAYHAGEAKVDTWLSDPERLSEQGVLTDIPDRATAQYVKDMTKTLETYVKLYYQS